MSTNRGNTDLNGISGDQEISNVARWFDNKSVFITGGTGFLGKVLVERLLTTCPGINKIFVLLRKKRDVAPEERLEELKKTPIFDTLKREFPHCLDKLVAITGDIILPELGISSEDMQLLTSTVNVVFHSAATVKFDEALRLSVTMNMLGTKRILAIAKKMTKLESMIHVSTAYSNYDRDVIDEIIYPPPGDMDRIFMCLECMDDEILDDITPKMIGNRPNTYTFTKALAEQIVIRDGAGLPISIIRPSIVTASVSHPMPGWVDNLNGPTGIFVSAGKGILRTFLCREDKITDLIPVDICINAMIVAAWNTAKENYTGVRVYNVTSGYSNPILLGDLFSWAYDELITNPFENALWYPGKINTHNKFINDICINLFHMIPAYIIDFSTKIMGKKGRPSMVSVQHKLQKAMQANQTFTMREWTFLDNNVKQLYSKLSEADKKTYPFDVRAVNWRLYIRDYVMGVRRYLLKEEDKSIPAAKRHLNKMLVLHYLTKRLVIFGIWRLLMVKSNVTRKLSYSVISLVLLVLRTLSTMTRNFLS